MTAAYRRALVAGVLGLAAATPSHAQEFPAKAVRIIVPLAPGGMADVLSRTVAHPVKPSSGPRKMPPPTPVKPVYKPIAAPRTSAIAIGGGPLIARACLLPVSVSINSRIAENTSTQPTSTPNHKMGS